MHINRNICGKMGFTMVEVLVTMGLSTLVIGSFMLASSTVKSVNMVTRHQMQALQVVKSQVEVLKVTPFNNIANSSTVTPFDAGADGLYGTADDLTGTLDVTLSDAMDMDGDTVTNETSIDVSGDAVNDPTFAVPVRVSFTWIQNVIGLNKSFTVSADTLIAA